jgi:hypothetical protein
MVTLGNLEWRVWLPAIRGDPYSLIYIGVTGHLCLASLQGHR